jgi:DNA-binding helix-hairpin-helix protein with protein kinase domain
MSSRVKEYFDRFKRLHKISRSGKIMAFVLGLSVLLFPAIITLLGISKHNFTVIVIGVTASMLAIILVPMYTMGWQIKMLEQNENAVEEERKRFLADESKAIDEYSNHIVYQLNEMIRYRPWMTNAMKSKLVKAIISKLESV